MGGWASTLSHYNNLQMCHNSYESKLQIISKIWQHFCVGQNKTKESLRNIIHFAQNREKRQSKKLQ